MSKKPQSKSALRLFQQQKDFFGKSWLFESLCDIIQNSSFYNEV